MSNILAYPAIPEVSEADLLIISDISEDGNPTRTVSVQALVGGSTAPLGLTVNGTSGAATLIDNILNIPIYTGGGGGTVTNVTYSTNINAFAAGVTNSSSSPDITLTLNGGNVGQFLRQDGEWATVPVSSGVTQIIGGTNVTVSPVGGTGTVTVNSTDQFIGTVTGVTGTLPITSSGGTTPAIGINNYTGADGTTAGTNGAVPAPAATDNVKFLKGDGTWAVPAGGGGTMSQWLVDDGGGGGFPITNNNSVVVVGTPKILVATNTAAKSITWTHADTARTDTTSTAAPAAGATFTVVDSITQDATGHPTAVNVKTVTMPASGGAGTTYDLASAQDGFDVDITLTPSTGAVDTVQLTAGTNITLTDNGSNNITIDAAGGGGGGGVSSIGLSTNITAFTILNSPITTAGTLQINKNGGVAGQYLNQDGTWQYGIFKKDANNGIYVSDRTVANYGAIGANSFDASFSTNATGVNGAVGDHSAAFGENNKTTQRHSLIAGQDNDATFANHSFVFGKNNVTDMGSSIVGGANNVVTGSVAAFPITSQVVLGYSNSLTSASIGDVVLGSNNTGGADFAGAIIGNTNTGSGNRQYIYGSDNNLGNNLAASTAIGNINSIPGTNSGYAYGNTNTISNAVTPVVNGYAYGKSNAVSGSNTMAYGTELTASQDYGIYIGSSIAHGDADFRRIIMPSIITMPSYADDTAAAAGGVVVGELYRDGSTIKIRVT